MGKDTNGERHVSIKARSGIRILATFRRSRTSSSVSPWKLIRVVVDGPDIFAKDILGVRIVKLYDALHKRWPSTKPVA